MAINSRSYSTMKVGNGTTVKIEYRDFASSTSEIAKEYALLGYPDKYVIFTEHQVRTDITETKLKKNSLDKGIFISTSGFPLGCKPHLLSHRLNGRTSCQDAAAKLFQTCFFLVLLV